MERIHYRGLNEAWYLQLKWLLEGNQECWFVTFSFPFDVCRPVAEEKLNEWIRRLRQTLGLKEEEISCDYVFARQIRGAFHIHALVTAKGLSKLDRNRWENKWTEITGQKKVMESIQIKTHRHPGVIRRRNEEETVVSSVIEYDEEVIDTETSYRGGGTCRVKPIQKDGKGYTPEGVARYIEARHSREVSSDMQFSGIAGRDF